MSEKRQRSGNIRIRLTDDEERAIRAKAQGAGVSVSAFVRAAALSRKMPTLSPTLLTSLANLGRLGGLLKLALAQTSEGGRAPTDMRAEIEATLASIRHTADAIRDNLR